METYLLIFVISLIVVAFTITPLIEIAIRKRLFDAPSEDRKIHKRIIPNLGGIAVFSGFLFSLALFTEVGLIRAANVLLASGVIIFTIGLKDDIIGVDPLKKFMAQFAAAIIISVLGDFRIMDLGGLAGVNHLSYPFSIGLSVFAIVGTINAFNLIDGIDGLAGCLGMVVSLTYAFLFYEAGNPGWTCLCLALAGALAGFLIHNVSPAKIFMGDCGSLMLGFIAAILSIQFVNTAHDKVLDLGYTSVISAPALAISIVIVPIFDTLRVFTIRIIHGQSPFKADRIHIHHRMLDMGLSHMQATSIIVLTAIMFISVAFAFQDIGNNQLLATLALIMLLLNSVLSVYLYSRKLVPEIESSTEQEQIISVTPVNRPATPVEISPEGKNFAEKVLDRVSQD